jgi:NAD-dependent deacetylase
MNNDIQSAIQLLRKARSAVALTGAGISTPSGIPDFRSPLSGLWENANVLDVATIFAFKTHPERFYQWVRPLVRTVLNAQPNAAHIALSRMQRSGQLHAIITQYIDVLHTRAGSNNVIEVHGHLREMTCISCYTVFDAQPHLTAFSLSGEIPHCEKCGGVLKPNVILFGEQLPAKELIAAERTAASCDVMMVIGSSLEVAPACDLPLKAKRRGAAIILINYEATPVDSIADVVIRDDVATILPQIADALEAV